MSRHKSTNRFHKVLEIADGITLATAKPLVRQLILGTADEYGTKCLQGILAEIKNTLPENLVPKFEQTLEDVFKPKFIKPLLDAYKGNSGKALIYHLDNLTLWLNSWTPSGGLMFTLTRISHPDYYGDVVAYCGLSLEMTKKSPVMIAQKSVEATPEAEVEVNALYPYFIRAALENPEKYKVNFIHA